MYPIVINAEFQKLIPALTDEEYGQLETNILKDGCRDPLSVIEDVDEIGNPFYIIIDGHNRYEICEAHGIPYTVRPVVGLKSREEIRLWIINNQLGRRNLSPEQIAYYRGEQYKAAKIGIKNPSGRNQYTEEDENGQQSLFIGDEIEGPPENVLRPPQMGVQKEVWAQNGPKPQIPVTQGVTKENLRTAETLAKVHGVSKNTIKRDAEFADAVNRLSELLGPEVQRQILAGKSGLTKKEVVALAEQPDQRLKIMKDGKMDMKRCARTAKREKDREAAKKAPVQLEIAVLQNWYSRIEEVLDASTNGDQDTVTTILSELLDQLEKVLERDAA